MTIQNHYDLIVIGSGAGGGTLTHRLAATGKKILLLERGPWLKRERENWDSRSVFLESRYKTQESWTDGRGKAFHPGAHYFVGGNTKVYGAALLRLRERDFEEVRHQGGLSPRWPIQYEDLAPFYDRAEALYHVHGQHGLDPTEPPRELPYPHPAVSHEPRIQRLHDDFARLGLHPFPLPLGIRLNESSPERSECIRCATCDGFPCLVRAKSDAEVTCVEPALAHGNVTLLTEAKVLRLETSADGREVRRVVFEQEGEEHAVEADFVAVSCGAVNSAALLLRSSNERHPNGLANRSGVVGRHYMCHNNSAMLALSREPNPTIFQKTLAVNDFYFGADDYPHPMGHIQMLGKSDEAMLEADAPPLAPGWVLDKMAKHSIDFWLTSEDLPDPDNRVTLDAKGGVVLSYRANNEEPHRRLQKKLRSLLHQIGCEEHTWFAGQIYLGKKIPLAGVAHQCGTVRFGTDPETSALDVHCRAHDVDNLYVVDGSFFCSSAAVNPGLTIIANALRVGDHLEARLNGRAS
ncbi:MAG: GMC family oxidoreductase [Planctomycetota bacterium]